MMAIRTDGPTPDNPVNGHRWSCRCGPCAIYWDTQPGTITYQQALQEYGKEQGTRSFQLAHRAQILMLISVTMLLISITALLCST